MSHSVQPPRTRQPLMCRRIVGHYIASTALALGSTLFDSVALAQDLAIRREPPSDLSPQNAAFELRFGPYAPRVDENLSTPVFEDFFGPSTRYMLGIEVDWQLWRAPYVGTLGVGVGWSYTSMSAPNQDPNAGGNFDDPPISQSSSLSIMPFYAVGVLRVDVLARELHIPLVPYGKFGLAHAFWWVDDGIDTAETDTGLEGKDTSTGTQAAVGGMFLLDVLEPTSARALDAELGINNSYLFFEWSMSDFSGDQMNVGSSNWVTGLAFEM
jgi:hypothetical protein